LKLTGATKMTSTNGNEFTTQGQAVTMAERAVLVANGNLDVAVYKIEKGRYTYSKIGQGYVALGYDVVCMISQQSNGRLDTCFYRPYKETRKMTDPPCNLTEEVTPAPDTYMANITKALDCQEALAALIDAFGFGEVISQLESQANLQAVTACIGWQTGDDNQPWQYKDSWYEMASSLRNARKEAQENLPTNAPWVLA
jgi:hypothetical protein